MRNTAAFPTFFLLVNFCFFNNANAQNLVPNPGFEEYKKLPYTFSKTCKEFSKTVENWIMPNEATSDYFNTKAGGKVNANKNFAGVQKPKEGEAYCGIIVYQSPYANYREYLEVKLTSKLKAGKKYIIQFYISLGEQSEFAIDRLGVFVGKNPEHQPDMEVLALTPTVETKDSLFFDNQEKWICIRESFVATGGENYLIIGNFRKTHDLHYKKVPLNRKKYVKSHETYYFIDNVCLSLEKIDGSSSCLCSPEDTAFVPSVVLKDSIVLPKTILPVENKSFVLNSVFFDTDKSELKPESFPSLDSLVDLLIENPEYKIEIRGHTDNSGDEVKNLKLSDERAKAVANYLVDKGIEQNRISSIGFGSSQPIASNETPYGKAKNRRVEYILKK